jgi:hypothetical protein
MIYGRDLVDIQKLNKEFTKAKDRRFDRRYEPKSDPIKRNNVY